MHRIVKAGTLKPWSGWYRCDCGEEFRTKTAADEHKKLQEINALTAIAAELQLTAVLGGVTFTKPYDVALLLWGHGVTTRWGKE